MKSNARSVGRAGLLFLLLSVLANPAFAALLPTGLRCEYVSDPMGVDTPAPRLFWQLSGAGRAQRQTAYQILAASTAKDLARDRGTVWDSGKVDSGENIQVPFAGRPLLSREKIFWKVRVWDQDGKASTWSDPASWTMGFLNDADWTAGWITAPANSETVLMRREFVVKPGLTRALENVCGLGQYELSADGKKVGDDVLAPGWTKYDHTCLYDTRDLTPYMRKGTNAIGLLLAGGMYDVRNVAPRRFHPPSYVPYSYGPLTAIAQLRLEYADGTVETIGTDSRWRTAPGPIIYSSIYCGEDFDARLVPPGWNSPGFDDSNWAMAQVAQGPGGKLRGLSCAAPPIRAMEVFKPVSIQKITNGVAVYDFGQNASLMPRLVVQGPSGASVKIIPSELLKPDGTLDDTACRGDTSWIYRLDGHGRETWFPSFFYRGARYFQVECSAPAEGGGRPAVLSLEAVVVNSSSPPIGQFECSNDLFNRIHTLVRWAQRANMMSVMTDCPQREKRGWLEEDHLNGPSLRYEFDLARLFTKTMNDMADSQLANGLVPTTAPEYTIFRDRNTPAGGRGMFGDSPEWGGAFILVPWQQYEFHGDVDLLRRHFAPMKNYVTYLGTRATGHVVNYGLGDWYDIGPKNPGVSQLTPIALTATAFYFRDAQILARVAGLLGQTNDAAQYQSLADDIRAAFNARFYDPTNHVYATGSQTANAIPLVMNLCEPTNRTSVLDAIVRDVRARGNSLTAGDVGYQYLLRALADGGRSDVIFDMNNQSEKPGYGFQLKRGATSLTEAWDAGRNSSQDHFMLGQIMEWFYHDLAGIGDGPESPGFKNIIIHPQPVGDVTWAKASYDSIRGRIVSDWKKSDNKFTLQITIPPNTTATVFVPTKSGKVREGKTPAERSKGVKFIRATANESVYEVGSGTYQFISN